MKRRFPEYKQTLDGIPKMLHRIAFPHIWPRNGGWLQPFPDGTAEISFRRLIHYATWLRQLGLSDLEITRLFYDLYWDAFEEFKLNNTYAEYKDLQDTEFGESALRDGAVHVELPPRCVGGGVTARPQ